MHDLLCYAEVGDWGQGTLSEGNWLDPVKKHKNVSFSTLYINNIDNTPLTLRAVNKGW